MADEFENADDVELGTGLRPRFETPMGSSYRPSRFGGASRTINPTTARLRRVSQSFLGVSPGDEERNQFGENVRQQEGGGQQQQRAQNRTGLPPPPPPRQLQAASGDETNNNENNDGDRQQDHQEQGFRDPPTPRSAQRSKFVLDTDVPDTDMLDIEVSLKKEDYGEPGTSDYRKNRAAATAALSEKFGVARHKVLAAAEDGDQSKYTHVQTVIVGILHRVKQGELRAKAVDWMDICTIPFLNVANLDSPDCSTWWDDSEVNIWQDWDMLEVNQVRRWQYSINKRFSQPDRIASNWLFTFVSDSSTDSLRTAVMKKYEKLDINQRGGVIYLYLTLCEMFQMSREVEEAMYKFIEIFKRTGISRYTGENVLVAQEEVQGVCKRLDVIGGLRSEHVMDVLTGVGVCSNTKFRDMFKHLKTTAELNHLALLLPNISMESTVMEQIEAIFDKAVDHYDYLCTAGLWNKAARGGGNALQAIVDAVDVCWNCGQKGHRAQRCRKPKDPVAYARNKKAWMDQKAKNDSGNSNGGGGTGKAHDIDKSTPEYERKQWHANGCIMKDGVLYMNCRVCGLNTNHSNRQHEDYAKNPTSFKMSANHFYVKECKRLGQGYGGQMKTATGSIPQAPPQNSGTIEKSKLESALAEYERNSTNPNASELSDLFRSLLLK